MKKRLLSISLILVLTSYFTAPAYATTASSQVKPQNSINTASSEEILKNIKKYNAGDTSIDINYKKDGNVFISGVLSDKKVPGEKEALSFLDQNKSLFGVQNAADSFKLISSEKDDSGYTHFKFNQLVGGLSVKDRQVTVHFDKQGVITAVNGDIRSDASITKLGSKVISANEAVSIAKNEFKFNKLREEPVAKKMALVVGDKVYEVYEVNIKNADSLLDNWNVYVETSSGKVVDKQSNIREDNAATGTGVGVNGSTKSLNLYYTSASALYSMRDTTKPMTGNIVTTSANHGSSYPGSVVTNATNIFNTENFKASVDAHYFAGVVYDFYKNLFGRNSIDNNGMSITSTTHYSTSYNNAFWDGSQMVYGDGDGTRFTYLSGDLDVVGHEMTHGVTQYKGGLQYSYQSGALNESYSDIFGVLIDTYNKYNVKNGGTWQFNAADWVVGDLIYTPSVPGDALRSLSNPTLYGQPADMDHYVNTSSDNGGVHTNSGIPNKAAFLIAQSLGMLKTAKIYERSYSYLNPTISFSGAAYAIKQAAVSLYGSGSAEVTTVDTAFRTVKVLVDDTYEPNDTMQTAYSINIGTLYQSLINSTSDVDYYKLNVSAAKTIDINLTTLPADYDLYLYDSSGNRLAYSNYGGTSSERIVYNITTPGNYYIKVFGYSGAYNTSVKYSLKVLDDPYEPNNTMQTAYQINEGTIYQSFITSASDVDFYKLNVISAKSIDINLTTLPADYDLYLYNSAGTALASSIIRGTGNERIVYNVTTAGDYYIKVVGYNGAFSTSVKYSLQVANDPYEPNNTIQTAYTINTGTSYQSFIYSASDVDYYKLNVSTARSIDINLTTLPVDYDLNLYNSAGTLLASSVNRGTTNERIVYNVATAGDYYIKVIGYNGAYSTSAKYSLQIFDDPYEPNNTIQTAYTITYGTLYQTVISSNTDVDYYKLNVTAPRNIDVNLTALPGDYDLYLCNSAGTVLASSSNRGTASERIVYNVTASGYYYIKVIGYNGAYNNSVKYSLQVFDDPYEPNNTMQTAYSITTGTLYQALIASATDVDYYKLNISSPKNIDIKLTTLPADYDLYLYNSAGTNIASSAHGGTTDDIINCNITTPGDYFIKVVGFNGYYNAALKYSLKVDVIAPIGALDSPVSNAQVTGTINVSGWFLDKLGVQKVEVLIDGAVRGQAVYGDLREDVYQSYPTYNNHNSGFHYSLNTIGISNGVHSIAFRGTNNSGVQTTLGTRNITVSNTPPPDTYEPNNTIGTAYGINKGAVYQSSIYSSTDVDYYKFTADTIGNIEINLSNLPKDYDIELVNAAGTVLKGSYADGTNAERISYNVTSTGNYYIKVYGYIGAYDQFNRYSLRVDKLNSIGSLETPGSSSTVSGNINVRGWYLDGNGVAKIEVLVDGTVAGKAVYGSTRADIGSAYPTYHNNNAGFSYILNTARFTNGVHTISVRMTNNAGYTQTQPNRSITINNIGLGIFK